VENLNGYLSSLGRIEGHVDAHGFVRIYIEGEGIYVEPQSGYVNENIARIKIPAEYENYIEKEISRSELSIEDLSHAPLSRSFAVAVPIAGTIAPIAMAGGLVALKGLSYLERLGILNLPEASRQFPNIPVDISMNFTPEQAIIFSLAGLIPLTARIFSQRGARRERERINADLENLIKQSVS
jgi:hypothetical protein